MQYIWTTAVSTEVVALQHNTNTLFNLQSLILRTMSNLNNLVALKKVNYFIIILQTDINVKLSIAHLTILELGHFYFYSLLIARPPSQTIPYWPYIL